MLPFLAVIFVFSEELMLLLFGGYTESAPIFQIYLGTVLVHFFLTDTILLAKGKTQLVLKAGLIELVVNMICSVPAVYVLGITGPAWVTLCTHIIFVLICAKLVNNEFQSKQSIMAYVSISEAKTGLGIAVITLIFMGILKEMLGTNRWLFLASLFGITMLQLYMHRNQIQWLRDKLFKKGDVDDRELFQGD
jgi:O-antigen/teichoic acid export membrane protein